MTELHTNMTLIHSLILPGLSYIELGETILCRRSSEEEHKYRKTFLFMLGLYNLAVMLNESIN